MEKIKFTDLSLSAEMHKAIEAMGFTEATPIQSQSIPLMLQGKDIIGQSQTGTGKTASFAIPAIERVDEELREVQTLVLCPTRELAQQVAEEFNKLLLFKKKIKVLAVYGGASIETQIHALRKGVHIVIGTPGRIMDHLDRGTLHLEFTQIVILDEADEMLDMGFREDIEAILQETPNERQTVFFSATMAKPIMELTKRYQKDPEIVKVTRNELTVSTIEQRYFELKEKDKEEILGRLIDLHEPKLCLVFCNTKRKVDELVMALQSKGYFAEALHGDMRQAVRTQVMNKFRQGIIQMLIATDVAARGIDVENVEMVVNYDLPQDSEYYVHRIGRTGRAGRKGMSFTFVTGRDRYALNDIERYTKAKIEKAPVPTLASIETRKKDNFLTRIKHTIEEGELKKYQSWVKELETEGLAATDIAAALIKLEIHHQIAAEDKLVETSFDNDRKHRPEQRNAKTPKGMVRLFITLGRKDKIGPKDILGAITGEANMDGRDIGTIDIYDKFSFVEVPESEAQRVIKKMKKSQIRGQAFKIEVAAPKK